MSRILRLALLLADTPAPSIVSKQGDYRVQFTRFLQSSIQKYKLDVRLKIDPYDVVNEMALPTEEGLKDIDGIMITGSAASAYSDVPWINNLTDFMKHVINNHPRVRIVGICFGHQIVARAMGGNVIKNPLGMELAVTEFELTEDAKQFFKTNRNGIKIQEMHQDYVSEIPPNFVNLGSTSMCSVQGLLKPSHVLTVQGHPEFTAAVVKGILKARGEIGVFSPEVVEKYSARAELEHDGIWLGKTFIEFILDGEVKADDETEDATCHM
ncbi:2056_t:CDS:2 [Paraglomus brasilianum]|uniref:2056_t:CDS:1 n=1 Tax=Paraglomus brasilianum TaxID=144538 RepID=A0A9N9ARL4_9GLOM|nr:2056_t:CDS:2 [Paraglomus brasilianum]